MSDDWRTGQPAIRFNRCRACAASWYVDRPRCLRCNAADPARLHASGEGVVAAVTRVERAPSAEWRGLLPYTIVLVDAAEGFRLMAHAAPDAAIGQAVAVRFRPVGSALLPFFERRGA